MDLRENLLTRAEIVQHCINDPERQAAAVELCKRDILNFFNYFLWTYDPRKEGKDIPFIPYPYQEVFIKGINQNIIDGESSLTEKSRDMGVTWMLLGIFLYRWLFFDESFLLGSRKQEMVDKLGNIDTHFERLRYMITKLPDWMLTLCGCEKKNLENFMKIFKSNGAVLTGESMNTDFSRQGRYKAILLDEFAFVDGAELIWRACGDSAPCKLPVSTPNGRNNFFAKLREGGAVKVNTIHWSNHPDKTPEWYEKQKAERTDKDVAQELDINYTVSAGEPFYEGFSRALHLRKMSPSKSKPLILSWDFGFQHPNCLIGQLTVEGRLLLVDNIFGENQIIDEFADYVIAYLNEYYSSFLLDTGYCDPAGAQASDKSRVSSMETLRRKGFEVRAIPSNAVYSNYAARKAIIEKKLKTMIDGIPSFIINDVVNNYILVEGFEGGYRYPDANKYGGVKESPLSDNYFEHPFNCLEYIVVNLFRPIEDKKMPERRPRVRIPEKQYETINAGISYATN
jgi:hypothetical protein